MSDPAATPIPPRLYRFRTYGAATSSHDDKREVFNLLSGRIRFSKLEDFNDPFEGRPRAVPAFQDAGRQRMAVLKYFYDIGREHGLAPSAAHNLAQSRVAGKTQSELVDWMGEKILENNLRDGLHLCCLSGKQALSNTLTWSHYADSHRGVAIHFSARIPPFVFAFPVIYSETYPEVILPRTHQDQWEHVERTFFTKSVLWAYEHEYRIMKVDWPTPGRDPRAAALLVDWDQATALGPPQAVVGITFGARMPEPTRAELRARITAEYPHLEIWQARLHRTKYEIVCEQIT